MTPATARRNMIDGQLYTNKIISPRLLAALERTPREPFLPFALQGAAYVDGELEVTPGRYLMAPLDFSRLVELAQIDAASRVLNIGCLSGYSAAVLAGVAANVVAIDTDAQLIEQARQHMKRLGINNVTLQQAKSLADGYPSSTPYNAIVICGAVDFIPENLGSQLAVGGRLVTIRHISERPGMRGGLGKGMLIERLDNKLQYREHFDAGATLLPGFSRDGQFRF